VQSFIARDHLPRFWQQSKQPLLSGCAILLLSVVGHQIHFNTTIAVLLYLLIIVSQSLAGGFALSAMVAIFAAACLDFFFLPPLMSLRITDPLNILALFVFLIIALVVTRLVSRARMEAQRASHHGSQVEQLYEVARRLLLVAPDQITGSPALKIFREVLGASAVYLFDGGTAELGMEGISSQGLAERTRQAYLLRQDINDAAHGVSVRLLRIGSVTTGAIGFEGLPHPETIPAAFSVLAAAALDRAQTFRRVSHETAAAQADVFRAAILDALAHEFKTPLATILAVVGGIRESGKLEPEQIEMADMIEFEISRLSRLTTRLLSTARLDREQLKPRLKPKDIRLVVERLVNRYTAQSPERSIVVNCRCGSVEALADRQLLDLALTQLLDNASKYSPPGSVITVSVQTEDGFITTRVENEGHPIKLEEQERIFERFYRGTQVRNLVSGTGLGLYVARKIATAHGGSLDLVKDPPRTRVVFSLKLPLSTNSIYADIAASN
jgi:two-component system, OmpR family, sensor histidine kinase KdpD